MKKLPAFFAIFIFAAFISGCAPIEYEAVPKITVPEIPSYSGFGPECPEAFCLSFAFNGDLLIHDTVWQDYTVQNRQEGQPEFDFTEMYQNETKYLNAADFAICEAETPAAAFGGPYADYPIFNTPPDIFVGAKAAGYDVCTHATNHSFDKGIPGVERTTSLFDSLGILHTGSYLDEASSTVPLIIETPGGKVAIITGTVSTNGQALDFPWRVDTLFENTDYDWNRFLAKAKLAREMGADVVVGIMHSVQEYIHYADSWQIASGHRMIDSGLFDLVYGHGSHAIQPIEEYKGKYIIYGLGNSVARESSQDTNNHGLTVRAQFAKSPSGYQLTDLAWAPSNNTKLHKIQWCSLAADHPDGECISPSGDEAMHSQIEEIVYSRSSPSSILHEWLITEES